MGTSPPIKVMLSSRCNDIFSANECVSLTEIRRDLKRIIEAERLFDLQTFDVWINEDAEAQDHTLDSWDACLAQVRKCDVLLVLYNGNAGWAKTAEDIGICHAEYVEGLKVAPGKIRVIELPTCGPMEDREQETRNRRFTTYKNTVSAFRGGKVATIDDLRNEVKKALVDAVLTQTRRGAESVKAGRYDLGAALEWSRLDFGGRRAAMETELSAALTARQSSGTTKDALFLTIEGATILAKIHAVPAAFTVAAAREPLGRPHLQDHKFVSELTSAGGPLHLIACHRTVTETQATNLLGFPDATLISGPFGIYVADNVQKMQFVFLANCRDPVQTRLAAQRFWEWLEQAGEGQLLVARAMARSRIVKAVAIEQSATD